ncbi:unnamed protein product [Caenorhabditis angaria]|uniref:Uncharacterized protein n=1 Tax=Caenorhabditis angaria TaxID=860376 RepID=A0A9P1J0X1_9PELO|nr:unnamed protein product [Caenorhabditis angaria]
MSLLSSTDDLVKQYAKKLKRDKDVEKTLKLLSTTTVSLDVLRKHNIKNLVRKYLKDRNFNIRYHAIKVKNILKKLKEEEETNDKDFELYCKIKSDQEDLGLELSSEDEEEIQEEHVEKNRRRENEPPIIPAKKVPIFCDMFEANGKPKGNAERKRLDEIKPKNPDAMTAPSSQKNQKNNKDGAKKETEQQVIHNPKIEKFDEEQMFKPRKDIQKVFAGRKKTVEEISSPEKLDNSSMMRNPNKLVRCCSDAPSNLIRPASDSLSNENKISLIKQNPKNEENDSVFEKMTKQSFPHVEHLPKEFSHWREYFAKLKKEKQEEENAKLAKLTQKIANKAYERSDNKRKTKLIDETHFSKFGRQKQSKPIMSSPLKIMPSAKTVSEARKAVGGGDSSKLKALQPAVIGKSLNFGASKSKFTSTSGKSKTVAPLMAKCMKMAGRTKLK